MQSQIKTTELHTCISLLGAVTALSGCGVGGQGLSDIEVGLPSEELAEISEVVAFENDRDEELMGVLVLPESDDRLPAVVLLHGAGGLFLEPDDDDDEDKLELESQFEEWAGLLAAQGYAVVMPSSFYSRGFFEWSERPDRFDKEDRLIMRAYDAQAALRFTCEHPAIDCARIGVVGFSNGASTIVLSAYEHLGAVEGMEELRDDDERPQFTIGVAYYPGCGLHGLISMSSDDPEDFYFPRMPVIIRHGERDSLVDDCETRLEQTDTVSDMRGYDHNPFELYVYDNVGHGFDSSPSSSREERARDHARSETLDILASELW